MIGAGLCGLYQVYRLREAGLTAQCFEEGDGIGGTWYWNRYPGCSFDSPSEEYVYSCSADVLQEWEWTHHFSSQPEAERYLNYVADKLELRPHIQLNARVTAATWHEEEHFWEAELKGGQRARAPFLISAVGGLTSAPYTPQINGIDPFQGEQYHTGRWPQDDVDLAGKRVAVIGAGPSAIQLIPEVAKQCAHLTVFQRTPNYAVPSDNAPGVPLLTYGLAQIGATGGFGSLEAALPCIAGLALIAVVVVHALRAQGPLLNLRLYRIGSSLGIALVAVVLQ